jgi:DNA mismatch repair protein MutL
MRDIDIRKSASPPEIKIDPNYSPFKSSYNREDSLGQKDKKQEVSWEEYYKIFQSGKTTTDEPNIEQSQLDIATAPTSIIECFQWINKYIVCSINEKLLIIDQHRAHEKIIYEKLKNTKQNISAQTLLFPLNIDLSPNDFILMKELMPIFKENGFDIEEFGTSSIIVNAYPDVIQTQEIKHVIENTLENFRINQIAEIKDIRENFIRSVAKSMAVQYGQILTKPEMLKLITELLALNDFTFSPTGKRIFKEIDREEISGYFKK